MTPEGEKKSQTVSTANSITSGEIGRGGVLCKVKWDTLNVREENMLEDGLEAGS